MMKEAYFYLSSSTGLDIHPQNTANNFRVQLPQPLRLDPSYKWSMAILDFELPKFQEGYKPKYITIESGVCRPSVYKNRLRPVLQRLYFNDVRKGQPITVTNPRYVPLNTNNIDTLDIYISDQSDEKPSFKPGSAECTLHLLRED